MVTVYHLNILAVAISHAGPVLVQYKDELKEAISLAFEAPSWKVSFGSHIPLIFCEQFKNIISFIFF